MCRRENRHDDRGICGLALSAGRAGVDLVHAVGEDRTSARERNIVHARTRNTGRTLDRRAAGQRLQRHVERRTRPLRSSMHRKRACATCSAELVAAVPVDDAAGMGQDCSCRSSALLLHCGRPGGKRTVWRGEVQVQPNLPKLKPIRRGCSRGNRFRDFAVARAWSNVQCEVGPPGVRYSIAVVGECVGGFLI